MRIWPNHIAVISTIMITKIISGGQTGADQTALGFAISYGIPHDNWIPKGRKTENGVLPEFMISLWTFPEVLWRYESHDKQIPENHTHGYSATEC